MLHTRVLIELLCRLEAATFILLSDIRNLELQWQELLKKKKKVWHSGIMWRQTGNLKSGM